MLKIIVYLCLALGSIFSLSHCQNASNQRPSEELAAEKAPSDSLPKQVQTSFSMPMSDSSDYSFTPIIKALEQGDSLKIICYGNSITHGFKVGSFEAVAEPYPLVLEKKWREYYKNPSLQIMNEGHNGWRAMDAQSQIQALVLESQADGVILMFGINDAYSSVSPPNFLRRMQSMVKALKAKGMAVLLMTPSPIATPYEEKVRAYAPLLKELAQKEGISFIDLNPKILTRQESEGISLDSLLPDQVHFADPYYAWIAEAIFQEFSPNTQK